VVVTVRCFVQEVDEYVNMISDCFEAQLGVMIMRGVQRPGMLCSLLFVWAPGQTYLVMGCTDHAYVVRLKDQLLSLGEVAICRPTFPFRTRYGLKPRVYIRPDVLDWLGRTAACLTRSPTHGGN
jgi:hypothetical protein